MIFQNVSKMRIWFQRLQNRRGFHGFVASSFWRGLSQSDLSGVEVGHEQAVGPFRLQDPAPVAAHPRHRNVTEIVDWREQFAGFPEFFEDETLIKTRIGTPIDPMRQGIATGTPVKKIHRSEDLAFVGEIELHRIIHAAAGKGLDLAPTQLRRPDPRALSTLHDLPGVVVRDRKSLASMAPEKSSVRMQKGAVNVRRIPCKIESGRQLLSHFRNTVAILIGETPETGWRHHVERIVDPEGTLREGEVIGKNSRFVVDPVVVCIDEPRDKPGPFFEEILFVEIDPGILCEEEIPFVVECRHHRMRHEPRRYCGRDRKGVIDNELLRREEERRKNEEQEQGGAGHV